MDAKTLFLSINNLTKSILLCYRKLCVLDFKGKSASVEYEKLLKLVDTLTELEDYYYSFIFNADNNLKDAFMDELLGLYNISQLKLIVHQPSRIVDVGAACLVGNGYFLTDTIY